MCGSQTLLDHLRYHKLNNFFAYNRLLFYNCNRCIVTYSHSVNMLSILALADSICPRVESSMRLLKIIVAKTLENIKSTNSKKKYFWLQVALSGGAPVFDFYISTMMPSVNFFFFFVGLGSFSFFLLFCRQSLNK